MNRPYRSDDFNDERKWKMKRSLDDVAQVGKLKAVGYVGEAPNRDLKRLKKSFVAKNKLAYFRPVGGDMACDTLWVADMVMMFPILEANKNVLLKAGWPTDAEEVFLKLIYTDVDHRKSKKLYHMICDLFNSWCLHCEKPVWVPGRKEPMSENPYDPDMK